MPKPRDLVFRRDLSDKNSTIINSFVSCFMSNASFVIFVDSIYTISCISGDLVRARDFPLSQPLWAPRHAGITPFLFAVHSSFWSKKEHFIYKCTIMKLFCSAHVFRKKCKIIFQPNCSRNDITTLALYGHVLNWAILMGTRQLTDKTAH